MAGPQEDYLRAAVVVQKYCSLPLRDHVVNMGWKNQAEKGCAVACCKLIPPGSSVLDYDKAQ